MTSKTKIKKITSLKNTESFLQVNTIKGFKYIDKAGEIVNYFIEDNKIPRFNMNLNGLVINNPNQTISELKISSELVWAKIINPSSLDHTSDAFLKIADDVKNILEVDSYSRVGWRNYFILDLNEKNKTIFQEKFSTPFLKPTIIEFELTSQSIQGSLRVQELIKKDKPEEVALLLDSDIYLSTETSMFNNLNSDIKKIANYLREDKGFLSIVNELLS